MSYWGKSKLGRAFKINNTSLCHFQELVGGSMKIPTAFLDKENPQSPSDRHFCNFCEIYFESHKCKAHIDFTLSLISVYTAQVMLNEAAYIIQALIQDISSNHQPILSTKKRSHVQQRGVVGSCRGDLQVQIRVASGNTNLSRILLTGLVLHLCRKMYIHLYPCIWNQCLNQ